MNRLQKSFLDLVGADGFLVQIEKVVLQRLIPERHLGEGFEGNHLAHAALPNS
jgi:hypothetical protein